MSEKLNIYQRMARVTAEIGRVAKNLSVGEGRSAYKAVGEADVLAAVRPAEEKHGVYSYPAENEIVETAILTSEREYNGQKQTTNKQFMRVRVVYRFVNIDDPAERVELVSYGDGVDPQDKAPGKAYTYACKTALAKAYKIMTGDDPDQKESEPLKAKTSRVAPKDRVPMASERQLEYLYKLADESETNRQFLEANCPHGVGKLTMAEASAIIGALKDGNTGKAT